MNLQQIRERLAGLANKTNKRRDLWKPKDNHTIRCLPYKHGDEPFIELGFHYELGATRSLLCPKHTSGKECPICDLADKLRSWKDENGDDKQEDLRKADFELFKKIQCKPRWYVAMIDRADENPQPKFWAFGKTIFERLLTMSANEEMNEIAGTSGTDVLTSPDTAFDLIVDFKLPNNEDKKGNVKPWPVTTVENKLRPTPLTKSKKATRELIDAVPNMSDVYQELSTQEVEKIFMDFINSGGADVDVTDSGKEYKANSAEKPVEGGQSIDEAFADLAK